MFIRDFLMSLATLALLSGCSGSDSSSSEAAQLEVTENNIIGSWELDSLSSSSNNKSISNAKAGFIDKAGPMNFFIYVTYEKDKVITHYFDTNDDKSKVNYELLKSRWQLIDGSIKETKNKKVVSDHKIISLTAQKIKFTFTADDNVVVTLVFKRTTEEAVQSGLLQLQANQ